MKHLFFFLLFQLFFFAGCARNGHPPPASPDKQANGKADTVIQDNHSEYGYHPDTEVPEGKGILSDEGGEFIIFKK